MILNFKQINISLTIDKLLSGISHFPLNFQSINLLSVRSLATQNRNQMLILYFSPILVAGMYSINLDYFDHL